MYEDLTVFEALIGVTGYPIPARTVKAISTRRGLDLGADPDQELMISREFRLCEADLLMWLFRAPNVGQGGQSYNFTDEQRKDFRNRAKAIYDALGKEDGTASGIQYGYKGSWV
jgi:hypothetical protein